MNERYLSQLKGAMAMFGSTSPNYLIMLSIDAAAGFLLDNGAEQINQTAERCARLRQLAQQQGFVLPEHCEPMRLTLPLAPDIPQNPFDRCCGRITSWRNTSATAGVSCCSLRLAVRATMSG